MPRRKAPPASVGVALIVKDGAKTLGACLKSIRPYVTQVVVCIDERTTDRTEAVARRCGADVIAPVQVSDWHACAVHGRVLAQHFGNARNTSFRHLDPTLDCWMWVDADDLVFGGEHLAALCAEVPEEAVGCWLPYRYSTINNYAQTTTLFDRERLLRPRVGWRWDYRVHEVVVPLQPDPRWHRDERVQVVHQEGVHKTVPSTTRNQLLLEIDWEEQPGNQRVAFYLGNGHFAAGRFAEAIHWYETAIDAGPNPWEVWQSCCYCSIAYLRLGDVAQATHCAFAAIDTIPAYRDGYYRLAEAYLAASEFTKAIEWAQVGLRKENPPPWVFVNPLDTRVNVPALLADAYGQLGHVTAARRHLEAAHAVAPTEAFAERIRRYADLEAAGILAQAFVELAPTLPEEEVLRLYQALPPLAKALGRTRDVAVPLMLKRREARYAA